jgi:hypothetical protein
MLEHNTEKMFRSRTLSAAVLTVLRKCSRRRKFFIVDDVKSEKYVSVWIGNFEIKLIARQASTRVGG